MSLESFIYNFGGGKIQLKYRIIEEKYSRFKRNLIESSLVAALIVQIAIGVALMDNQFGLLWVVLGVFFLSAIEFWVFKFINRSVQKGMIYFHQDHILILNDVETSILYTDISSIYLKKHLNSHRSGSKNIRRNAMSAYAYYIQINTSEKKYTVKAENDLWLTEEDKLQFHRYYPLMMYTLEEIHRVYRTKIEEKPKNFTFESN